MFKKTFSSKGMEPIGEKFPKGCQFMRDNRKWTVTEVFEQDNTSWRRIVADDGTDEVVMLSTLDRDNAEGVVTFIEPVNNTGIEIAKRAAEEARIKQSEKEQNDPDTPIEVDLEKDENQHKFHKKF